MNETLSLRFIAQFNLLDKYLEDVLSDCDNHTNFVHKIRQISQGEYSISQIVHQYYYELNTLSNVRNQLVHTIGQDQLEYLTPTTHALDQLMMISMLIMKPLSAVDVYAKPVINCRTDQTILEVIQIMVEHDFSHIPTINHNQYSMTLSQHHLFSIIAQYDNAREMLVKDFTQIDDQSVARFGPQHSSLDVEYHILTHMNAVAYLSQSGLPSAEILGIVTEHDLVEHADLGLQHQIQSV